ncbi:hypothetical protein LIER_09854 [Lithospermum erythrorhizon]|uniref:Gag1-like clamp domain-containing protein n=1 Tax=Lithospermum erythrorhizon TaxID=34254 RepID=A0AAV3PJJ4_LITER
MLRYMMLYSSFSAWFTHFLACMGSCLGGCCSKSQPTIAVDEPSNGLRIQGRMARKLSMSEDFWSSSTYEIENSTVRSQRSQSSTSISNQSLTQVTSTGSNSNHPEFVNHGLLLWNQTRLQWVGTKKPRDQDKHHESPLCWSASCESLLGTNRPFPQPIPLSDMVDFLVDIWEHEGLYD